MTTNQKLNRSYLCISLASLTTLDLHGAVLYVERVVVEVHQAGQSCGEPHAVDDGPVTVKAHNLVLLRHVVQVTGRIKWKEVTHVHTTDFVLSFSHLSSQLLSHTVFLNSIKIIGRESSRTILQHLIEISFWDFTPLYHCFGEIDSIAHLPRSSESTNVIGKKSHICCRTFKLKYTFRYLNHLMKMNINRVLRGYFCFIQKLCFRN